MKRNKKKSYYLESYEEERDKFNRIDKKEKKKKRFNLFKAKNILKLNKIKLRTFPQKFNKINYKIVLFLISYIILFGIIFLLIFKIFKKKSKTYGPELLIKEEIKNPEIIEEEKTELKRINFFIKIIKKNHLILNFQNQYNSPKISIIIKVYNDGKYLNSSIISIQNQDLKDIEIIIVDDCSTDNSVNLIREFMQKDSRILLFQNEENKGDLYSKTKGILNAKGKYVMILENKDIYLQSNAFSTLYVEAEKNDLDILGFAAIINFQKANKIDYSYDGKYIHHFIESPIIIWPNISQKMYYNTSDEKIHRAGDVIFNYFFKAELFKKIINQIDDIYLDRKMNYHVDFLFFFLLTRNANRLKHIKKIFYFSQNIKMNLFTNSSCLDYLYYSQFLLNKVNRNIFDKKIASYEFENWYFNTSCKDNIFIKEEAINISKSFSEDVFIDDELKKKLYLFMFEHVTHISN